MDNAEWMNWLKQQFPKLNFVTASASSLSFTGHLDDGRETKGTISVTEDAIDVDVELPKDEDDFAAKLALAVQEAVEPEYEPPTHFDSFESLRVWARSEYALDDNEVDWFSFVVEFDDVKRSQKMFVRHTESPDESWVVFASVVAPVEKIDATNLLKRNMVEPVATFAIDDENLVQLVYSFPLEELTDIRFGPLVHYLAARADDVELELTGADEF